MSIFSVIFSGVTEQITAPDIRLQNENSWQKVLVAQTQIDNNIFNDYITGSSEYSIYNPTSAYTITDRVIYSNNGVYEALTGSTGTLIGGTGNTYWLLINPSYIGAIERASWSARKLTYEYALNRQFQITGFCPTIIYTSITQSLFAQSAGTIFIQTLIVPHTPWVMAKSGLLSSGMAKNTLFSQQGMVGNTFYWYSGTSAFNDYVIWYPQSSGATASGLPVNPNTLRQFANTINMAGMLFSLSGY